jgi:hypothetical protein
MAVPVDHQQPTYRKVVLFAQTTAPLAFLPQGPRSRTKASNRTGKVGRSADSKCKDAMQGNSELLEYHFQVVHRQLREQELFYKMNEGAEMKSCDSEGCKKHAVVLGSGSPFCQEENALRRS